MSDLIKAVEALICGDVHCKIHGHGAYNEGVGIALAKIRKHAAQQSSHESKQRAVLKEVREKCALIQQRCGVEMDYGSGSDAVQNGSILAGEALAKLNALISQDEAEHPAPLTPEERAELVEGMAREIYEHAVNGRRIIPFEQSMEERLRCLRQAGLAIAYLETQCTITRRR